MATATILQPTATISYLPSLKDHQTLTHHLQPTFKPDEDQIPEGFPSHIDSPLAWDSKDMIAKEREWTLKLSPDDITSIERALSDFKGLEIPWKNLSPQTFVVSEDLQQRLVKCATEIHSVPGFVLIRGLNAAKYSVEECIMIQAGLTSYVGTMRGYNSPSGADVLTHVRDLQTFYPEEDIVSPTFTNKAMTMHTDLGDVVSLFTVNRGSEGGSFRLVSSATVYNKLAASVPVVLRTLSENFVFDTLHPEVPSYEKPLLHYHDGKIILQSFRRPFTGFGNTKRSTKLPPMSEKQMFALDELYFRALNESMKIDFQNGDLLLFHNMAMLHSRDAYQPDESNPRHLLKLFVRNEHLGWKIPTILEDQWEALYSSRTTPRMEDFPPDPPVHAKKVPHSGWSQNG